MKFAASKRATLIIQSEFTIFLTQVPSASSLLSFVKEEIYFDVLGALKTVFLN